MNACRILDRLWEAECSESDIWFRQDYRQAFICVSLASRGEPQSFITSSYRIYGSHPDKVWPKIMANRKARLGKEFLDWYDQAGNVKPEVPGKKPAIYIPDEQVERAINQRLAAVLMFPRQEVSIADADETDGVRRSEASKGNLYEIPRSSPVPLLPMPLLLAAARRG